MSTAAIVLAAGASSGQALTGTIQDVQHVVILMQENRSFDHYFGAMPGVRGFNDRNPLIFTNGNPDFYQPSGNGYCLPFPTPAECIGDLDHGHPSGLEDWDSGNWDQWVAAKGPEAMSYYPQNLLPFHYALANNYTVCDANFCSMIGPTYPNRLYLFTGTIDPDGQAGGPALANNVPAGGFTWTTYPERLQNAGVSWRVYRPSGDWYGDVLPWFAQYINAPWGSPLYQRGVLEVPDVAAALRADVTNGTLPRVSWIIPPSLAGSEHPPYSPSDGAAFIKSVLDALAADPAVFRSTVFILTYDENDGFFDHIPSPTPPPGTPGEYVGGQPIGLGVRVPMILVSPWSRGGRVCSQVFDHTSILRFLETWTGVREPNISAWRRQVCGDLTSAFDFTHPDMSHPDLPTPISVETVAPSVNPPSFQSMPAQPAGSKVAMSLPYQPEVVPQTSLATGQLILTLTNSGSASVHFAIYANFAQTNLPCQLDANTDQAITNFLAVSPVDTNSYDYTCYGANGFQRRFAGGLSNDANQIEAWSVIDTNAGTICLLTQDIGTNDVQFLLTDNYGLGGPWTNDLSSGGTATNFYPAIQLNNGWYDLTVTASSDPAFLRHLTGHIENGSTSYSEPSAAPLLSMATTQVVNGIGVSALLANIVPAPSTNPPPLFATTAGQNLILVYPAWASNYVVQASPVFGPGNWSPLSATMNVVSNYAVVSTPMTSTNAFFRLQQ